MLKKLWVNRVGALIVLLCTYLLVFGFIKTSSLPEKAVPVDAEADSILPVIVLDAGHGGIDSGCVSVNGAEEKDINLNIRHRYHRSREPEKIGYVKPSEHNQLL